MYIHFVLCVNALSAYMYVYHVHAEEVGGSISSSGTGARDACETPGGC